MNASEKRRAVRDKYKLLLGRNKYSQSLRGVRSGPGTEYASVGTVRVGAKYGRQV